MIYFIIFVILLSIYEINYIMTHAKGIKVQLIILYIILAIMTLGIGVFYYSHQFGNSIGHYILKILNIHY